MNISWLKLSVDILDDQKIRVVRRMPEGNSIFVLWVGLLCLAMKSKDPGKVEIDDGIPYTDEDLAHRFDLPIQTVRLGLATFERLRMIGDRHADGLEVINFRKHQSLDKIDQKREADRIRQIRSRESRKNRLLAIENHRSVTRDSVTRHTTDIDKETDIEKEKEEKMGAVAPRPPASEVVESSTGKKPRAKKDSPQSVLFDNLVKMRQDSGTMPVSGQDQRELFSHQARVMLADIEHREGLDQATAIFAWAFRDKFWGKIPVVPRNFLKYKTAMGQGPNGGADQFARVMAMIEKDRQNGQA